MSDTGDTGDTRETRDQRPRRCRGERGVAMVTGLVLLFAFTAGAVIWLARDVNRVVSNQTAAQSIAFQAARSGAQQLDPSSLRAGEPVIDRDRADVAARATARQLFDGYQLDGIVVSVEPVGEAIEVTVRIDDPAGDVTGVAMARPETAP